jgi:hypothetical protein
MEQWVTIAWTPCRFGGERPWFVCSAESNGLDCGRWVSKLYSVGGLFACRHCHRLAYESQQESTRHRGLGKARKIRMQLGGSANMFREFPHSNACRLERRPGVRERIEYLSHQDEGLIAEKRRRIEEFLWSIHEAAIGDYFETVEVDGKTIERPKRLSDLPREIQQNVEKISVSANGRLVPQLYSKLAASQELRKMLSIGRTDEELSVRRLSDAELVAQLTDQAKQLGVEINLNYAFLQQQKPDDERQG